MKHTFIYNGMNARDYGLTVSGEDTWTRAQPDVKRIAVPGRNGDIIQPGVRFKNVDVTYHCGIIRDLEHSFDVMSSRLLSESGYHRLEDSYHPEVYRLAVVESALEPNVHERGVHGEIDITFNCMPQRYLKSGEQWIRVHSGDSIRNPTLYPASPRIRFSPAGVNTPGWIEIGGNEIWFDGLGTSQVSQTEIDCVREEIYEAETGKSRNGLFTLMQYDFFKLEKGSTTIRFSGLKDDVLLISPGWWTV